MARIKSAEIKEIVQDIQHDLSIGLTKRPSRVKQWFVNNVFRRTFAYLIAWTDSDVPVKVRATSGGALKFIALPASAFSDYVSQSGTATDIFGGATHDLGVTYYQMDILVENYDLIMQYKKPDATWGADIVLTTGWHSINLEHTGFRLKNRNAGSNGDYNSSLYK